MRYNDFIASSAVALVLLSASSAVFVPSQQYQLHQLQSANLEVAQGLDLLEARAYEKKSRCWYATSETGRVFVRFMMHKDDGFPLESCDYDTMDWLQELAGVPRSDTSPVRFDSDGEVYGDYCEIMANGDVLARILNPIKCLMPDNVLPICV